MQKWMKILTRLQSVVIVIGAITAGVFSILQYFREDVVPYLNSPMNVCVMVLTVSVLICTWALDFRAKVIERFTELTKNQPNLASYSLGEELKITPQPLKNSQEYKLFKPFVRQRRSYCIMAIGLLCFVFAATVLMFWLQRNTWINIVLITINAVSVITAMILFLRAYYDGVPCMTIYKAWTSKHPGTICFVVVFSIIFFTLYYVRLTP